MCIPWDGVDEVYLITRSKIKGTFGIPRGDDAAVNGYLANRFAHGVRNHGKGTKKDPGYFYGFVGDSWAAYALGVAYLDLLERNTKKDQQYLIDGRIA
jgi:hypothetical protein